MARRAEAEKTPTQEARFPTKEQYQRYRKRMKAAKAEQDEAKGRMGSAKETAIADYNLHADADRVTAKYLNKSPAQAAEFMLHLTTYWEYMALGEPSADMLETPAERKKRVKAALKKGEDESDDYFAEVPEQLGRGTHAIRAGKVVPFDDDAGQSAA